ncbi:MAG TPA: DUF5665 domain-containing protein [Bacillota bacterium]|jgi:hypothetical protein
MAQIDNGLVERLIRKVEKLSESMEKMKLAEYVYLLQHPWRLLYVNFIGGVARGFGVAMGFTLITGVVLYLLQRPLLARLPYIGNLIAELVRIVNIKLGQ